MLADPCGCWIVTEDSHVKVIESGKGGKNHPSGFQRRGKPAPAAAVAAAPEGMTQLSARENDVLELLVKGLLQKEIAQQLGISYWTVQTHIARIYEKLHVHSRAQAVAKYHGE